MSKEHFYQASKEILKANNKAFNIRELLKTDKEKAKLTAGAMAKEFEAKKDYNEAPSELIIKTSEYLQELETQKEFMRIVNQNIEVENLKIFTKIFIQEVERMQGEIIHFIDRYVLGEDNDKTN
ncbi:MULTISPECIES: hypothetical protein [unclassified Campylobacter]|uniref:hypothetical protein n=1 Tax=unclassified Campylobacter TaxID=2593542 RepID=UPI001475B845|nr:MULTISPECIES: hypothetical protein [unclassified Campylobacter]